jgi:hypothetical protein
MLLDELICTGQDLFNPKPRGQLNDINEVYNLDDLVVFVEISEAWLAKFFGIARVKPDENDNDNVRLLSFKFNFRAIFRSRCLSVLVESKVTLIQPTGNSSWQQALKYSERSGRTC